MFNFRHEYKGYLAETIQEGVALVGRWDRVHIITRADIKSEFAKNRAATDFPADVIV